jgi:hypothetical protein
MAESGIHPSSKPSTSGTSLSQAEDVFSALLSHDHEMTITSAVGGTSNLHHHQLMTILNINVELSDRDNKGLVWCYKKYKAFNAAVQLMDQLSTQGKWPLPKKPSLTELVEVFMSKSYWHSHVVKPFGVVARYPQMVAWLERQDSDDPGDLEIWHQTKSEYGFKELKEWLANDGTLDKITKAQFEKAKTRKGKAKQVIGSDDEKDRKAKTRKGKGKRVMESEEEEDQIKVEKKAGSSKKRIHKRK